MKEILKIIRPICWFIALIAVSTVGCKNRLGGKINEGLIEYKITYPADIDHSLEGIMPSSMKYKFKNENSCGEMSSGMGLFNLGVISNADDKTVTQLLKIFNKKYAAILDINAVENNIKAEPAMKIVETKDTKMIAGYKCKKARIIFEEDSIIPFDIFYTDEFNIPCPNWSNHFRKIKGVLMEFNIRKYNIEMRLTAQKVDKISVDDEAFKLPEGYNLVSKKEFDDYLSNFK